ncbi:MAG: hypothetical protein AB7G88_07605 [Thermomicrobiales bacterium]
MTAPAEPVKGEPPSSAYQRRVDYFSSDLEAFTSHANRLSNFRLMAGALLLATLLWYVLRRDGVALIIAAGAGIAFAGFIVRHRQASRKRDEAGLFARINTEGLLRQSRSWSELPLAATPDVAAEHPYARDLDIFGHASLFHLLDTTATPMGSEELAGWLAELSDPHESKARQHAIGELSSQLEWRQTLQMLGRLNKSERRDPQPFLDWAESEPALPSRRWLVWLARVGALATVVFLLLALSGIIPAAAVIVPLIVNLILGVECGRVIGDRNSLARDQHPALKSYSELLRHIDTKTFDAPMLRELLDDLGAHTRPAHAEIRRLGRITSFAVPRSALNHFALQAVGNWDLHVLDALERWQRDNGMHVRKWQRPLASSKRSPHWPG